MTTEEIKEYLELKHLHRARAKFNQTFRKHIGTMAYIPPAFNERCGYWEFYFKNHTVCEDTETKCFEEMRKNIVMEERTRS